MPKPLPPKYSFHYFLCQQSCLFSAVSCGQAACLRGVWRCCLKPSSISWPVLSTHFYQRWVQISYLEFLLLTSWEILCIPDSDVAYPKDKGKWKTLQHKSFFIHTWSVFKIRVHLSSKTAFVFPKVKKKRKEKKLQRFFSFKGWAFLWLFVFHIGVKFEHRAVRARAYIASYKITKMAAEIVQPSSKAQLSSWSCIIWMWSSPHALQHSVGTREGSHSKCKH